MKFTIYNDVHLYGPHSFDIEILATKNAIYLGDNVDINHCKIKELKNAMADLAVYKKRFGPRFVAGNHELDVVSGEECFVSGKVCFTHGDLLFWGEHKRAKYIKSRKPGANWFTRSLIVATLDSLRKVWPASYGKKFKRRAHQYATKHKCTTIVCGHKHPIKRADFMFEGVRIIVLPRGKNRLELKSV